MNKTIYKYPLCKPGKSCNLDINISEYDKIIYVGIDGNNHICLWAEKRNEIKIKDCPKRRFTVLVTGDKIPNNFSHIGTSRSMKDAYGMYMKF